MSSGPPTPQDDPDRRPSPTQWEPPIANPRHIDLADRITEDALQLLFTARQDIAEGPPDPILSRAQFRVLDAIEVLRGVAHDLREPQPFGAQPPMPKGHEEFQRLLHAHKGRRERWQRDRQRWLDGHERRRARGSDQ